MNADLFRSLRAAEAAGDAQLAQRYRDQIWEANSGLIGEFTRQYKARGVEPEEYEAYLRLQFTIAMASYNPDAGSTFAGWAFRHFKKGLSTALGKSGPSPFTRGANQALRLRQVQHAARVLQGQGEEVTAEAVAEMTGLSVSDVARDLEEPDVISLDAPTGDEGSPLGDLLPTSGSSVEELVLESLSQSATTVRVQRVLDEMLKAHEISHLDLEIVERMYMSDSPPSFQELAEDLSDRWGVSRQAVHYRAERILRLIRQRLIGRYQPTLFDRVA